MNVNFTMGVVNAELLTILNLRVSHTYRNNCLLFLTHTRAYRSAPLRSATVPKEASKKLKPNLPKWKNDVPWQYNM